MVAYSFNSQQYEPAYGGGKSLPPGKYKGIIVDSRQEPTKDGRGGFLALDLKVLEGALTGQEMTDRLNLHNISAQAVEIANKQLSAYCHVLGKFAFNDTAELHNIPFCFEVAYQKGKSPAELPEGPNYTQIIGLYDVNGNPPSKAGSGPARQAAPVAPPPQQPPAGVQPASQAPVWGQQQPQQPTPVPQAGWQQQPSNPAAGGWAGK